MKQQQLIRTAKGIFSNHNNIHGIPEGGLLEGDNGQISRPGVISKIRGRNRYGNVAAAQITSILEFEDTLLRLQGQTLEYDNAGTWTALTGTIDPPTSTHRVNAAEDRRSLFLTTLLGIYKMATISDTPIRAGIHEALDLEVALSGTGAGAMPADSQVAYRILFGRTDANEKKLLGAPSWREVIVNPAPVESLSFTNGAGTITVTHAGHGFTTGDVITISDSSDLAQVTNGVKTITVVNSSTYTFAATGAGGGGTLSDSKDYDLDLEATIPTDIVAGDFWQIYRTVFSASATTEPDAEYFLVKEKVITSSEITAGKVTHTDTLDEAFLGEPLYTNTTVEGENAINARPPYVTDSALWKGHLWGVNYRQPHALEIQLQSVSDLSAGNSTITITDANGSETYTAETAENIPAQEFFLSTTEPTLAQNVEETMKSFCRVVNRDTNQSRWEARYISGPDDAPGQVEIRRRDLDDEPFWLTSDSSSTSESFQPEIPTSGTTLISTAESAQNGLIRAKFDRPEAFPPGSTDSVGPENREVLRALPLRDSLILPTRQGIYRVTGETDGATGESFFITQLDPSINAVCPGSWVILNNAAFGLSTQGVVKVDESGTVLVSDPIEEELKKLFGFPNFEEFTQACAYESERSYLLYVQEAGSDESPVIARVYNYLTNTWMIRRKRVSAAHVLISDDKLYEAHAEDLYVLKERKSFTTSGDDHKDEDIAVTITALSTTTNDDGDLVSVITLTYTYTGAPFQTGVLLTQGIESALVRSFTDLGSNSFECEMEGLFSFATLGAATVALAINMRIRWRPEIATNAAVMKQFAELQFYFESNSALEHLVGVSSDVDALEITLDPVRVSPGFGWGETEWGDSGWGDDGQAPATPVRVWVPREHQRCRSLTAVYEHRRAKERVELVQLAYSFRAYDDKTVRTPR